MNDREQKLIRILTEHPELIDYALDLLMQEISKLQKSNHAKEA